MIRIRAQMLAWLIALAVLFIAFDAYAGYEPVYVSLANGSDTIIFTYRKVVDATLDTVYHDTLVTGDTAIDTTFGIDSDTTYQFMVLYHWAGMTDYVPSSWRVGKMDATAEVGESFIDDFDSALTANHGAGSWTSSGDGSDTIVFYAVDTSGTDQATTRTKITVKDAAGNTVVHDWTSADSGRVTLYIDPGTYQVIANKTGFVWESQTLTVDGNDDSVAVIGYDIKHTSNDADYAPVYGYIKRGGLELADQSSGIDGVRVEATRERWGFDSTGTAQLLVAQTIGTSTDSTGFWELYLARTNTFSDTTKGFWTITGTLGGDKVFEAKKVYIPATGALDLTELMVSREP